MKIVSLPSSTQFHNLNTLSGYAPSSALVVTNNTSDPVFVVQSATQPLATADAFPLFIGKSLLFVGNDDPVWVMGDSGPIVVQTMDGLICPGEMLNPRVMVGLEAITTQSFTEANCKNGVQYELATYDAAFTAGTNRDFIILTGDNPVLIKERLFTFTGDEISATVYRNPTYTGGTPVPYFNSSTINPIAGAAVILGAPTVTAVGTQVSPTYRLLGNLPQTGQAVLTTDAAGSSPGLERVLAPNSVFLFRTTNSGSVTSKFSSKNTWYEGHLSSRAF